MNVLMRFYRCATSRRTAHHLLLLFSFRKKLFLKIARSSDFVNPHDNHYLVMTTGHEYDTCFPIPPFVSFGVEDTFCCQGA